MLPSCSDTRPMRDDPYFTSRDNSLDIYDKVIMYAFQFRPVVTLDQINICFSFPRRMVIKIWVIIRLPFLYLMPLIYIFIPSPHTLLSI